jgi:hypothetical protein
MPPEDELAGLGPADLAAMRAWVEDRMINAIAPLAMRLQLLELAPGPEAQAAVLGAARHAVERVLLHIEALRRRGSRVERACNPG